MNASEFLDGINIELIRIRWALFLSVLLEVKMLSNIFNLHLMYTGRMKLLFE